VSLNYMLNNYKRLYTTTKASIITSAYKNYRPEEKLSVIYLVMVSVGYTI